MKRFARIAFALLVVFSLVSAQNSVLFAQSPSSNSSANNNAKIKFVPISALTLPSVPTAGSTLTMPALNPPQSSNSKKIGVGLGLALIGTGTVLLIKKEEPHQTTCIPYGACPRPGIVKITGGTMVGIGVPLTILKLRR